MEFWSDAQLASIDRMLNPRSIAVVGATPRMQYGGALSGGGDGVDGARGQRVSGESAVRRGSGLAGVSVGVGIAGSAGRGGRRGAVPCGAGHAAGIA